MGEELLGIIPIREQFGAVERFRIESKLHEKFRDDGIKVYLSIDSKKNAEELKAELGLADAKLIEILNFMEREGIIKLKTIYEFELEGSLKK
ncbi:MAG: hypothetical protein NTY73_03605 [Candidatus Micrarchaeota archaeon]|nr:hypothetical protein [Candidatus Micrarchaeota archaeon]